METKFEIAVDSEKEIITIHYHGDIDFDTWMQTHNALINLDGGATLRNARIIVADFTQATLKRFSSDDVTKKSVELVMKTAALNSHLHMINITPQNLEYGLIRMLQSHVEDRSPWQSYLVKSRDECDRLLQTLV